MAQRDFWTLNPDTLDYEPAPKVRFDSIGAVRKIEELGPRLKALLAHDDRAANYLRDILYFGFAYAAWVAPQIAYSLSDVDDAMRWGFSHEAGPFEMWDMLGVRETAQKMEEMGLEVAPWVKAMLASGQESFYENGRVYDFNSGELTPRAIDKKIIHVAGLPEVERNLSASLRDMGDGVALLEFHAKMNAIDQDIIDMSHTALARLESDFDALVIGNDGQNFCVGANLFAVAMAAGQGQFEQLDGMIRSLQEATFGLRHAPKPVVTAVQQMALGGGAEYVMAGWETVAAHESYIGLVEFGVGVVPAGGGCKEVLRRGGQPGHAHRQRRHPAALAGSLRADRPGQSGHQRLGSEKHGLSRAGRPDRHEQRPPPGRGQTARAAAGGQRRAPAASGTDLCGGT